MAPPCPTREQLDSFQAGDLEETALAALSSHVESCPNCQRSLETIIGDSADTVLQALLAEPEPNPFGAEAACRLAIERVAAIAGAASPAAEGFAPTVALEAAPDLADDVLPLETIREYKLLAKLGEGGMGAVYKALHTRLDKVVALKVLPQGRMRDGGSVARFQREMKAVGRLDHPNIVRAMDAGEEDGTHFLVMEYVEGADLSQLARNIGPLPVADACELVRQAAIGLQEAHEHGMVHRDIKPSNLILAKPARKKSPPTLKILDLGLALLAEALAPDQGLTSTGQMMGTIDYMAPEQGSDTHHVDIRADIYSLGATLYRLLTGSPPFSGERFDTPVKKILALATKEPAAVGELRADVPPALVMIVHKMLAKDPAKRHSTPEEVAEALAPFCQGANLAALLARDAGTKPSSTPNSEAPTHAQQSSPSADTAPTIDRSFKLVNKSKPPSRTGLAGLGRKIPRPIAIAAACGGAALVLLLGVVFYLETIKGTIRIEIKDDKIKVVLDERGATFEGVDKQHSIRVQPGQHDLTVKRGDLIFHTDKFELKKGETLRLSVIYLPGKVQVVRDGEKLLAAWDIAEPNYALHFDGVDDVVKVPSFTYDNSYPVTMEAWLTLDKNQQHLHALVLGDVPGHKLTLKRGGNARWEFLVADTAKDSWVEASSVSQKVQVGRRDHVAGTWDGKVVQLFVNGELINAKRTPSGSNFAPRGPLQIGYDETPNHGWKHPFAGTIDQVRISKGVRYRESFSPAAELAADANTLALYQFGEGTGEVLKDTSGHNHHGKIVGAKWVKAEDVSTQSLAGWQWPKDAPKPAIAPFDAKQARKHQEEWADHLKVPVEYENSLGMKFVLIPPGEFLMGSTPAEIEATLKLVNDKQWQDCINSEGPQHRVILTKPIYLGVHEVKQADYEKVMGKNPSFFAKTGALKPWVEKVAGQDTAGHPVEGVSWNDAAEFCAKLSELEKLKPCYSRRGDTVTMLEGTGYCLPTEAQWEFGCRAGTTTKYWTGDKDEDLARSGWFLKNSGSRTHGAGELQANPFGLYDVHGNAWEWVQDGWSQTYYGQFQKTPALDPSGPSAAPHRVIRGGDCSTEAYPCRAADHFVMDPLNTSNFIGFRTVLPVEAVKQTLTLQSAGGYALEFNGKDSYVDLPTLKYDGSHPITLEATITTYQTESRGTIISDMQAGPDGSQSSGMAICFPASRDGHGSFVVVDPLDYFNIVTPEPLTPRRRMHVAAVLENSTVHLFVDGTLQKADKIRGKYKPSLISFLIGTRPKKDRIPLSGPFSGIIDEVRISKVARYDKDYTPESRLEADADTLALYHFDEGQGDVLKDSSAHNHHGKIVGAKWVRVDSAATKDVAGWHGWPKDAPAPAIAPFDAKQATKHQQEWAEYLGVPVEYENSLKMMFVLIPPGEFTMGSTEAEIEAALNVPGSNEWAKDYVRAESPKHKVILTQPIYLGIHEVTQRQYETVTGQNPSHFSPKGAGKNDFGGMDRTNCPAENIRWIDAAEFCIKLSQHEKLKPFYLGSGETVSPAEGTAYRLPTEAQWEFACRAGTTTRYWTGDKDEDLLQAAWFKQNAAGLPRAVGTLKPNPFGLYDVHGNIWEWVHDWWEPGYYGQFKDKPAVDPSGPASPATVRMLRGGNWSFTASDCRSSGRLGNEPAPPYRSTGIGFRVALPVDAVKQAKSQKLTPDQ